jgi:hypothetical protein
MPERRNSPSDTVNKAIGAGHGLVALAEAVRRSGGSDRPMILMIDNYDSASPTTWCRI